MREFYYFCAEQVFFKRIIHIKRKFNHEQNQGPNHETAKHYSIKAMLLFYLSLHLFLLLCLYLLFLSLFSFLHCFPSHAFFPLTSHSVLQFVLQLFSFSPWLLNILPFTAFVMNEPAKKASV